MIEINKIDTIILGICGSILGISEEIEQNFQFPIIYAQVRQE